MDRTRINLQVQTAAQLADQFLGPEFKSDVGLGGIQAEAGKFKRFGDGRVAVVVENSNQEGIARRVLYGQAENAGVIVLEASSGRAATPCAGTTFLSISSRAGSRSTRRSPEISVPPDMAMIVAAACAWTRVIHASPSWSSSLIHVLPLK